MKLKKQKKKSTAVNFEIPRSLYAVLAKRAEEAGMPVDDYIQSVVAEGVAHKKRMARSSKAFGKAIDALKGEGWNK